MERCNSALDSDRLLNVAAGCATSSGWWGLHGTPVPGFAPAALLCVAVLLLCSPAHAAGPDYIRKEEPVVDTVEDAEGIAYVLRKGDRVRNGRIVAIKVDRVVASQTFLGYTSTVQLKLEEERGSHG